ncbi:MAG: protein kinase [Myxococcales bacterium]|nr:protein kinase [Myxococcales bacterium]
MGTQFGRFELLDRIGVGGMAEVWKARVAGIGGFEKILVLKKILPEFAQNKTFVEMLLNEARLCAVLQHANIVQTFENGEINGQYYIAMEYVQGQDLFKVLSRVTQVGRNIPVELCLFITAEVAKGLAYAHAATDNSGRMLNIIHRDVSPSNVLLSGNGEVKVMDFGVARATMDGASTDNRSRAGVLKGKLGYMSPEQVTGQPFDFRSDIFSLGIILYESVTLKRLFLGRTDLETLVNIRDARIEHKFRKHSYIEEPVRAILRKALARDPDDRYASALDFHDDIVNLLFQQKTQVTNRTLSAFLKDAFSDEAPATESKPKPPATKSQNSLTFSPDQIRRQQEEIKRRRAEQLERNQSAKTKPPVSRPSSGLAVGDITVETAIEPGSLRGRRSSPRVAVATREERQGVFSATTPDNPAVVDDLIAVHQPSSHTIEVAKRRQSDLLIARRGASGKVEQVTSASAFAPDDNPKPGKPYSPSNRAIPTPRRATGVGPAANRGISERGYRVRTGDGHVLGPMSRGALEGMVRGRSAGVGSEVSVEDEPFRDIAEFSKLYRVVQETTGTRGAPEQDGTFTRVSFPRLVYRLFADRATGCLELTQDSAVKSIYFRKGRPVHIASNQMAEMLGPFLVKQGIISERDVEAAVEASHQGQGRLGDVLVAMNFIKPFELYQVLEKQFRAKFVDAFGWESGTWAFFGGEKPPSNIVPLDLDPVSAMVEGVRSRVSLASLEPHFQPFWDRGYHREHGSKITVEGLRLQAREAKSLGILMASKNLREAIEERCRNRQQRLALLHVMLLLTQTDLLAFDDAL